MAEGYDLVIRGGTVIDGSGHTGFVADVAVSGGRIVEVGKVAGHGTEEIEAYGQIVTPGFVDIHTHYDGQVTWEETTEPSSNHGVTTVVMGNCGVGFAPCRPKDRQALIHLMEGVEDVPEIVMAEGLPWNWETFPEYLDAVDSRSHDIDVAAQLPHSCLRVYVMGERALAGEDATPADLVKMRALSREAMEAGAIGFGTSRTIFHKSSQGADIPSRNARETEIQAIADGMNDAGHGVIEAIFDMENLDAEFEMFERVSRRSGRPVSFSLAQLESTPGEWRRALDKLDAANRAGLQMKGQVIGRPTGVLMGLDLSYNPLSLYPSYAEIASLPLDQRVEALRQPERRKRILSEASGGLTYPVLKFLSKFDTMFALDEPINYEPSPDRSLWAIAEQRGVPPLEVAYDMLIENEGHAVLIVMVANYVNGSLDPVLAMLKDDNTLLGLGDGGAHYGMVCDAGYPTFMLTHWARDREKGEKLSLARVVKGLSRDTAAAVGLLDRGLIKPGYKADLNVIDFDNLTLYPPRVAYDLPAGGRRLRQAADGYTATIVSGVVSRRNGEMTGKLVGKLVRGPQAEPAVR